MLGGEELSLEQIRAFLEGSEEVRFEGHAPELYTKLIAAGYEPHAIIKAIAWERRQPRSLNSSESF